MAMTISEANDVARLLHLLARDHHAPATTEDVIGILDRLNRRAAKPLNLTWLVDHHDLDAAARELVQRLEDTR